MRCYTQRMVRRFMHEMPPPSLPLRSGQPFSATAHTNANTNANTNAATSASASGNSNNGNGSAAGATGSKGVVFIHVY